MTRKYVIFVAFYKDKFTILRNNHYHFRRFIQGADVVLKK